MYKSYYNSPLGKMILVSDGKNLIGLWIEGQKYFLGNIKEELVLKDDLNVFKRSKEWLDKYFNNENPSILDVSLLPNGTEFNKRVWNELCKVPYGETITYGKIAEKLGLNRGYSQAVGNAIGHNPIMIIIPCHRVIGKNGNLTGYAGGIDNKIKLLKLEGINTDKMHLPKKNRK